MSALGNKRTLGDPLFRPQWIAKNTVVAAMRLKPDQIVEGSAPGLFGRVWLCSTRGQAVAVVERYGRDTGIA
jgi:hypothetical protein